MAITRYRFDKFKSLSLYPERFTERGTGIIDSIGSNRDKEDIVVSRIVIQHTTLAMAMYRFLKLKSL